MPERIHERLGCFGYFGFGGGWEYARRSRRAKKAKRDPGREHFCNVCPVRMGCWKRHRQRAAELFPAAWELMEEIMAKHPGDAGREILREWSERTYGATPPDLALNGGNIEDGMRVGGGGKPKDRGPYTISWPLERLDPTDEAAD